MEGSRERLLYTERLDRTYDTRRYDSIRNENRTVQRPIQRYAPRDEAYRPIRKNGYITEDIYSDFDENQGRLSLFRPIRPEFLNLPNSYENKYSSLPRNYYAYDDRYKQRYKKDYYDFRIESERRKLRTEKNSYEPYKRQPVEPRRRLENESYPRNERKNVAVCKPIRLPEKPAQYWSTDPPNGSQKRKKLDSEPKKNVKFSEVSGCNRKTIVDDPICGRKVVPVRELEVSLDQMIQNGYFEKHNIPITRPLEKMGANNGNGGAVPNGNCLKEQRQEKMPPVRRSKHLPQVSYIL